MSSLSKSRVVFNGTAIGLIFISANPNNEKEKVATIVPMGRNGKWTLNDLTIVFEKPVHDFYPAAKPDEEIQKEITGLAGIEPWKVTFHPTPW
ncbi:MAG: hypothetical protein HYX71_03400 [Opitutae bacterium]|nr:hypothetical protein [Opitutae bacterium]